MATPEAKLIHQIVALIPELGPIYSTHLEDNYGELLPHLMMGDITRWVIALFRRVQDRGPTSRADLAQLRTVVAFLEEQFASGDEAARELIGASFLENLWQADEHYAAIKNVLGPSLRASLDQMDS